MKLYLGVDLGSTTSKAVLVDGDEHVVGRGITNTRSNYDVAVEIARRDAMTDARLALALRLLGPDGAAIAEAFWVSADLARLDALRQSCRATAAAIPGEGPRLAPAVDVILARMVDEASQLFNATARSRGSFFRDIVGARFHALAEEQSARAGVDFERVLGVYDRAILDAENQLIDLPFDDVFAAAVAHAGLTGDRRAAALAAGRDAGAATFDVVGFVGTGYGRARLPFPRECIRSEILCHGLGAHAMLPATRTVLDIGGQDTKAIQVDGHGLVTSFQMNDRCAAGCGRYLGYIADELQLGLHELGPLALTSKRPSRITSTCTVFAGTEIRDLLAVGEKREDVLSGLHRAIITRAMSLLARSGGVTDQLTFTGGVARNQAAVNALDDMVRTHYGPRTINVHADSIYTGALGAALFARRGVPAEDLPDAKECAGCNA
ncbi:MAG: benzoyl-CoA reductase subunit A [Myxococcales bacterium]|nr:benzoyl-CoA reductase subunit A [Myxococcales bacterium]